MRVWWVSLQSSTLVSLYLCTCTNDLKCVDMVSIEIITKVVYANFYEFLLEVCVILFLKPASFVLWRGKIVSIFSRFFRSDTNHFSYDDRYSWTSTFVISFTTSPNTMKRCSLSIQVDSMLHLFNCSCYESLFWMRQLY
jgi:enoyl reductase-like protein